MFYKKTKLIKGSDIAIPSKFMMNFHTYFFFFISSSIPQAVLNSFEMDNI